MRAEPLSDPAAAALPFELALTKQMFAAFRRTPQHIVGLAVAIKSKQPEYRARTATDNVQLFVRCNKVVIEQFRHHMRVHKQVIIMEKL